MSAGTVVSPVNGRAPGFGPFSAAVAARKSRALVLTAQVANPDRTEGGERLLRRFTLYGAAHSPGQGGIPDPAKVRARACRPIDGPGASENQCQYYDVGLGDVGLGVIHTGKAGRDIGDGVS